MEARTHWIFDDFCPDAPLMRQKIEEQFDENIGKKLNFRKRTIWNYWYIDKLYTYLRAEPRDVFPELYERFMSLLRNLAIVEFGLSASIPFLSMYINGCGQGLHNDAHNGRLGYVFSLTKWNGRHFEGGETIIHKFDDELKDAKFHKALGTAFYHLIEPEFNRLVLFDDRLPHAVRPIQGTMNPLDARFVLHGHLEEPPEIAYLEGSLRNVDLTSPWKELKESAAQLMRGRGFHGFTTFETIVDSSGQGQTSIKHSQLIPLSREKQNLDSCLEELIRISDRIAWPSSTSSTKLIYALCSDVLS